MSVINKPSSNRPNTPSSNRPNTPSSNRSNMLNRPNNALNRPNNTLNRPANTSSFLQASMGTVNNALSNVLPASVMNNSVKQMNQSFNAAVNGSESGENYIFMAVLVGIFILAIVLIIYFQQQITYGLIKAWNVIKDLFGSTSPPPTPNCDPNCAPNCDPSCAPKQPVEQRNVIEKLIPKRKEVFNIAQDKYTYSDAEPLCKAFGAELATYDQVKEAYDKGADWCNYGWIKGQTAVYPTQKVTYDKLQAGPEDQRASCGIPGINGGYFDNPELRFGVNCYGDRPSDNDANDRYKAANKGASTQSGMEYDKKVRDYKVHLNEIPVNSFSAGTMAV